MLSIPAIHPRIPFRSPTLRADYFSFILTNRGKGVYYLDDNSFPFGPRSIYFTNPGHSKSYLLNQSKEGYIITLTEEFLQAYVHSDVYQEFPFLLAEIVSPTTLPSKQFTVFDTLYKQILSEFQNRSRYKNRILGNLFTVFLLKIKEDIWRDYDPIVEGNRNSQIVRLFKQLLEAEFRKMLSDANTEKRMQAKDFANELHLHPNYLNSVIRSKTGKTINDWLVNKTLIAAKSLLGNTSLSAKEIAFRLGFSEPTHFNRFFKNLTKTTPRGYRRSLGSGE